MHKHIEQRLKLLLNWSPFLNAQAALLPNAIGYPNSFTRHRNSRRNSGLNSGRSLMFIALASIALSVFGPIKAAVGAGQIGYVGCSMTADAVEGYHDLGGLSLWPDAGAVYGSGGVTAWARVLNDSSRYWYWFQGALNDHPETSIIWWQLCALSAEDGNDQQLLDNARAIRDELKRSAPNATIYVSSQPSYSDPGSVADPVCRIAGPDGPQRMQDLANQLISEGGVEIGPVIGPLTPDLIVSDGCHGNTEGKLLMGQQLMGFFDNSNGTDSDSDGVDDSVDNCPTVANPYQGDNDGNGVGNACEGEIAQFQILTSPTMVNRGTSATITLTGQDFQTGMVVTIFPYAAGVRLESLTVNSSTSATIVINIDNNALTGWRGLTVDVSEGLSGTSLQAFQVQ